MLLHSQQQQQQQLFRHRFVAGPRHLCSSSSFRLRQEAISGLSKARFPSISKYVRENRNISGSDGSVLTKVSALQSSFDPFLTEGPSCVFVGPVETADKDRLEALYQQARDSYYNGKPLILDDMFDKVEVRLRWYGSKLVLKYPRCSLKRLSVYADAEVDDSQVMALASVWTMFLVIGLVAALGPSACAFSKVCEDVVSSFVYHQRPPATSHIGLALNASITVTIGFAIGVPVATAAFQSLKGLWRGELVALKGCCPSCGEEVYTFIRTDNSLHPRHKTECHVCEQPLVFHAKVKPSSSQLGRPWAYGRIYLVRRAKDLAPRE